jgi:L-rhamnose mutarotase
MARMAADARNQEWWSLTIPCQRPLETRAEGEWWARMEEVFHHD